MGFITWIKRTAGSAMAWLSQYLRSGRAKQDVEWALTKVGETWPLIEYGADIATALTPTPADDALWRALKVKYPDFFNGQPKTLEEMKVMLMLKSAEALAAKYSVDTTKARLLVQAAYSEARGISTNQ